MENPDLPDSEILNSQSKDDDILKAILWLKEFESADAKCFQDIRTSSLKEPTQLIERPVQKHYLPRELLNLIFKRAVPPSEILSLSPDMCRYSAWTLNLRTKSALVAVSFDWYRVGIDFLYTDIAVYSIGQLTALEWTLRNRRSLAEKVVSIHFACYVPKQHSSAFKHILKSLRSLCKKVTRIFVHESFRHEFPFSSSLILPIFTGRSLTHLTIHEDDAHPALDGTTGKIALFAEHLVSLVVYPNFNPSIRNKHIPGRYRPGFFRIRLPPKEPLRFPRLKFLQLSSSSNFDFWILPALTTLAMSRISLDTGLYFVKAHRLVTVETLCLNLAFATQHAIVEKVLRGLPRLRHLIVPSIDNLSIPQIHHLDLIQSSLEDVPPPIQNRANRFPNLKGYRAIDVSLLHIPWIYTHLPPNTEGHFRYPGIDIRASVSSLWGTSSFERNFDTNLFSGDSDSEWVPEPSDSDDESTDSEVDCELSDNEISEDGARAARIQLMLSLTV